MDYTRRIAPSGRVSWVHKGKVIAAGKVPIHIRTQLGMAAESPKSPKHSPKGSKSPKRSPKGSSKRSPKRSPVAKASPPRMTEAERERMEYGKLRRLVEGYIKEAETLKGWKVSPGDAKGRTIRENAHKSFIERIADIKLA